MSQNVEIAVATQAALGGGYPVGTDMQRIRTTESSIKFGPETASSDERDGEGKEPEPYLSGYSASATVKSLLSHGNQDPFLGSALRTLPKVIAIDPGAGNCTFTAANNRVSLAGGATWGAVEVGDVLQFLLPAGATNGGPTTHTLADGSTVDYMEIIAVVSAVVSATEIDLDHVALQDETPAGEVKIRATLWIDGVAPFHSVVEEEWAADDFRRLFDAIISKLTFEAQIPSPGTFTAEYVALKGEDSTTSANTADGWIDAPKHPIMPTNAGLLAIRENGVALGLTLRTLKLTVNAPTEAFGGQSQEIESSDMDLDGFSDCQFEITVRYKGAAAHVRNFIDQQKKGATPGYLYCYKDGDGRRHGCFLPRLWRMDHTKDAGGRNSKVEVTLTYKVLKHLLTNRMFTFFEMGV